MAASRRPVPSGSVSHLHPGLLRPSEMELCVAATASRDVVRDHARFVRRRRRLQQRVLRLPLPRRGYFRTEQPGATPDLRHGYDKPIT